MIISFKFLQCFCRYANSVPQRTPRRLQNIIEYGEKLWLSMEGMTDMIQFEESSGSDEIFKPTQSCFERLVEISHRFCSMDYAQESIVLIPEKNFCCGKVISIDGRYQSDVTLYTEFGVRRGYGFRAYCKICGNTFHYGYQENKKTGYREYDKGLNYLLVTTFTGFSLQLLHEFDMQIMIGVVSFESAAEIYNNTKFTNGSPLNSDRLEAAWFLYKVTRLKSSFINWPRKASSEFDLEKFCSNNYTEIRRMIDSKWIDHVCDEPGCKQRMIVIDGNEKLYRMICNADKEKITPTKGAVTTYNLCIRNPMRGNQHLKASKYCEVYSGGKCGDIGPVLDLRPITRQYLKNINETITSGKGCKESKNVDRFYNRTAGMFYMFRSCGIRLSHWEMYTSESLSNVFTYLVDIFGEKPDSSVLQGIIYDRSCDLHPFLTRLSKEGNEIASKYQNLKFIVDIFHAEKHTLPKCVLSHPECIYHPHLKRFESLKKMNTEVAEQSFSRINPFKYMTRKMSYCRRLMFLKFVDDNANEMKSKGLISNK